MRVDEISRPGLQLLDRQLIDRDGMLCGNVDDLLFETREPGLVLTALLTGPGTWPDRLPKVLQPVARLVLLSHSVRIPIEDVDRIDGSVHLKRAAKELGLGLGEERASRWLSHLPRARAGGPR